MSFYKLPKPWNPGYVIPNYVMAEPPERGTITTQWLPRGTIPQLIPDYLAMKDPPVRVTSTLAQHSLKGTCFDDHSLAGHTLGGDSLGATEYSLEPLGAVASFAKYGAKVAKNLMDRMKRLPASHRPAVMKKTLAAIDKTLPARAEKHAMALRARGVPAPQALQGGIARAVSEGAVTEVGKLGMRKGGSVSRRMAPSRALRGRGRSLMALGALTDLTSSGKTLISSVTGGGTSSSDVCRKDANGVDQFVWIAPTATQPGYWQRLAPGQTCSSFTLDPTAAPTTVTVHDPGSAPVTGTPGSFRAVQIGPFQFPADQSVSRVTYWGKKLPLDWQAFISRVAKGSGQYDAALSQFFQSPGHFNPSYIGLTPLNGWNGKADWNPVARATHPDSGKDYGVFLALSFRYADRPMNDPTNVPILNVIWAPIQKSWYEAIWDWIEHLGSKIVDVVGDALDAVKDATCSLLQQPGIDQAAVSAAAATPSVPTAGLAAGVVIGQQLCGGAKQPSGPGPGGAPSGAAGWLVPVAIGGGLLLVYAITR